jgi:hypothetical protein
VVAFAGHRVDALDEAVALRRFPGDRRAAVEDALDVVLHFLDPVALVGAAAAGSDLLLLEHALLRNVAAHIVLPIERSSFVRKSVAPGGSGWSKRFDRVLSCAASVTELALDRQASGRAVFYAGNVAILHRARAIATTAARVTAAVTVCAGPGREDPSATHHFVALARALGVPTYNIDPVRPGASSPERIGPFDLFHAHGAPPPGISAPCGARGAQ